MFGVRQMALRPNLVVSPHTFHRRHSCVKEAETVTSSWN